ncbi:hypothetical protein [Caballeronia sp. TF1N1]|uniref:hypothetical protein n=1 Tax=Caballeronia sp. TF1N1 TaxID=2878153 RepID=UPI001FD09107|nr:hypothetical protein [Caballeronia sp. TF1N1]
MHKRNFRSTALAALVAAEALSGTSASYAERKSSQLEVTLTIHNACSIVSGSETADPIEMLSGANDRTSIKVDCTGKQTPYGVSVMSELHASTAVSRQATAQAATAAYGDARKTIGVAAEPQSSATNSETTPLVKFVTVEF